MAAVSAAGPSRYAMSTSPFEDNGAVEHLPSPVLPPSQLPHEFDLLPNGSAASGSNSLRADATANGSAAGSSASLGVERRIRSTPSATTSDTSSIRSASLHSASVHSSTRERALGGIFARRGSALPNGRRPKSASSNQSSSHVADDEFEMTPMSRSKKKRIVEDIEKHVDRAKADAALGKWRRWIAEQPPQEAEAHPILPSPHLYNNGTINSMSSSGYHGGSSNYHSSGHSHNHFQPPTAASLFPRYSQLSESHSAPFTEHMNGDIPLPSEAVIASARGSIAGPSTPQWVSDPSSSEASHARPLTPHSTFPSLVPGAQEIYLTESVRMLRDVELAVDPVYYDQATGGSPNARSRRLSTHPRLSDMENPFCSIDTLLARRRIRPLVLELVQALGAYIDAVWATTHPGRPCPWAGVPIAAAVRRASLAASIPAPKTWRSWTLTAAREAKRQGFLANPPTVSEVAFWGWEIRYGLRDIDEAVNRRKDLGWAFGEVVIRGQYGDILPANVFAADGGGGNLCRLLNDLEEALWGDAMPAPSDLAFEHDFNFNPFSVYREGDELIGVETTNRGIEAREAEMRKVFGVDFFPAVSASHTSHTLSPLGLPPHSHSPPSASHHAPLPPSRGASFSPDAPPSLSLPSSPKSKYDASPRTPADAAILVMPDLDFVALGALQEMTMEEKLELGRRRHKEYLERTRLENAVANGTPGLAL